MESEEEINWPLVWGHTARLSTRDFRPLSFSRRISFFIILSDAEGRLLELVKCSQHGLPIICLLDGRIETENFPNELKSRMMCRWRRLIQVAGFTELAASGLAGAICIVAYELEYDAVWAGSKDNGTRQGERQRGREKD